LSGLSSAAVVNIDFNSAANHTYSGLAAAPDTVGNNLWNPILNNLGTASGTDLKDSAGTTTTIDLTLTGIGGTISNVNGDQERSGGYAPLMRDYLRIDSTSSSIVKTVGGTLSGLIPTGAYEIYFYGQGENFGIVGTGSALKGQNSIFTINGTSKQTSWDHVVGGNGVLAEGIEYVKFSVSADINGNIDFFWSNVINAINGPDLDGVGNNGSRYGALNAIQIVAVPETSTVLLGGLGMLGLAIRRRR
jgi:hypothetical protein